MVPEIKQLIFILNFCIMKLRFINICERQFAEERKPLPSSGMEVCVKEYPYRARLILIGLLVFLVHGAKLNSDIIGIDTEDLIHLQDGFYGGWLHTGRQGLVFLKYLFGNRTFNPYYTGIATLLLFAAAVAAHLFLWDKVCSITVQRKRSDSLSGLWACGLGAFLWISQPVMTEQFYFLLQSMEICVCLLLTALSLELSFLWAEGHHPAAAVGSVLLLLLTFSSYQSFVVLYIFGTVAVVLLRTLSEGTVCASGEVSGERKLSTGWELLKQVIPYCVIFLTAFLCNTLITKLFFSSSDYLQNQIFWGQASIKDCIYAIGAHFVKAYTGVRSIFYHGGLGLLAFLDFLLLLRFSRGFAKGARAVLLFFYLALLTTPFLMTVVLGGAPAARSQLVLPALTGVLGYLSIRLLELQGIRPFRFGNEKGNKKWQNQAAFALAVVLCLVTGLEQTKVTESLYYTDRCRYEQDVALGRAIIERIQQINMGDDAVPVLVVGAREFSGNHSCVMGEVIGRSFFAYDTEIAPISFWNTRRVLGFLHSLGADFEQAPKERIEEALEYSTYMPEWPAKDSVQQKDGIIIVKLSHYE